MMNSPRVRFFSFILDLLFPANIDKIILKKIGIKNLVSSKIYTLAQQFKKIEKMSFQIRDGLITDMPSVWELIKELASFEKESNAVDLTIEDLQNDGFGKTPLFKCFVAEMQGEIVGMALFYPRYSTWKGPTIHLEDLIVTQSKRGLKIGSALYTEVIKYSHSLGVKRIEWAVLDWNEPAIAFYEKTGAVVMRDWDTVQMSESAIEQYIQAL